MRHSGRHEGVLTPVALGVANNIPQFAEFTEVPHDPTQPRTTRE
jgi:hypothetical protein